MSNDVGCTVVRPLPGDNDRKDSMTTRLDDARRPVIRRGVWKLAAVLVAANIALYGSFWYVAAAR